MPDQARIPAPANPDLMVASRCGGAFFEHRSCVGLLIWEEDWWDHRPPTPLAVLPETSSLDQAEIWMQGFVAGRKQGEARGEEIGRDAAVAGMQAGFRVLAGIGDRSDPIGFQRFVQDVGGLRR